VTTSTKLNLPYLAAGQAQKHVTVNESLLRLDALVQLNAVSAQLSAEPSGPADGACYILPAGKTGDAWGGMGEGALAYYRDGAWEEIAPNEGWRCFATDEQAFYVRSGGAWKRIASVAQESAQFVFTPGGDGATSLYRCDAAHAQNPRTATISSVAGDVLTLSSAVAATFFSNTYMAGVSFIRIWNTSKSPAQSAWVKAQPSTSSLQVIDAAAIAGWSNGEAVQVGDPTEVTPNRVMALDISPMLTNLFGAPFRQKGIACKGQVSGAASGIATTLDFSNSGATGTFNSLGRANTYDGSAIGIPFSVIPCTELSPISNSNLVMLRETTTGSNAVTALCSSIGVWV